MIAAAVLLLLATPVELAVERDGTILERTDMSFDADAGVVRWREREYPVDGFYLVESGDGACLWAPDLDARLRGYELLARVRIRERAEKLFAAAIRCRDAPLARELFELAQDHGLEGRDVERARKRLLRLEKRDLAPSDKAAEVKAEAKSLLTLHVDLVFARTKVELANDGPDGLRMLREVLRMAPGHEGAAAALEERAPENFPLGGARLWLDWQLDVEGTGAEIADKDTFAMRQALKYWRKDLHGINIGPALVVTPVKDTRTLGRMLGCCRITTDLLAKHFERFEVRRKRKRPLRIFLFENQKEYLSQTKSFQPMKDTAFLEYAAGHYSPDEGISRLFWVTDRDAENRIIGTAVHELAHHWLAEANPAYNHVEGRRSPRTAGFWIVEGFAEFLQEGVYDIDRGTYTLFDRRAPSLDILASLAPSGKLIPWQLLYTGSAAHFWGLPREPTIVVRRRWRLGSLKVSIAQLWYVQSAATCHYLYHAEGGKYRKALFDYIVNHYTGKGPQMDVNRAFGMKTHQLGKRVEAFAQAVSKGWEPGKGSGNDGK